MNSSVGQLLGLLRAAAAELPELSVESAGGARATLAQQLLYTTRTRADSPDGRPRTDLIAPVIAARVDDLLGSGIPAPALITRYSTSWLRHRYRIGRGAISAVAVGDDASLVIASGDDGTLFGWRADSGPGWRPVGELSAPATAVALAPGTGDVAVIGDQSGAVHVVDLADGWGPVVRLGAHAGIVHAVCATGTHLFSAGVDGQLLRWDRRAPDAGPEVFADLGEEIFALAATDDHVLAADARGRLHRWSHATGEGHVVGDHGRPTVVTGLVAARSGEWVVSCGYDGTIRRWPVADGAGEPSIVGRHKGRLWRGVLTAHDTWVVASTGVGTLLSWPVDGSAAAGTVVGAHDRTVTALGAARDGTVISGGRDGLLLRWSGVGDRAAAGRPGRTRSEEPEIRAIAVTGDQRTAVTGGRTGIHRWPLDGPELPAPERIADVDVRTLVRLHGTRDEFVALVRPAPPPPEPDEAGEPGETSETAEAVATSGPGETGTTGGPGQADETGATEQPVRTGDELQLWTLAGGEPTVLLRSKPSDAPYYRLAAVPGARAVIATRQNGNVERIDIGRGGQVDVMRLGWHRSGRARAVAVTPDGAATITTNNGLEVFRWSALGPGLPRPFSGYHARVTAIAVTPDGGFVIAGDEHGRTIVWSLDDHRVAMQLHEGRSRSAVRDIVVDPDNRWVATVADDGAVRCWRWPVAGLPAGSELIPVALPRALAAVPGGFLVADRYGGLTRVDVRLAEEPEFGVDAQAPAGPVELVVVIDNWGLGRLARQGRRIDQTGLSRRIAGGRTARSIIVCPDIPELRGMRSALRAKGLRLHNVDRDRNAQYGQIKALLVEELAQGLPVVLHSTDRRLFDRVEFLQGDLSFDSELD
ncbi:WD40 repeat domain-containing protein [Polymorphospora lycopeni]|uniref:WD40 repeat domain-containing protein n=1 Tax=Polymorphospora lycopeni TaxID=3140240 RepID=A0ABV5CPR1_9ACTN